MTALNTQVDCSTINLGV